MLAERGDLLYRVILPLVGRFSVVRRPRHYWCRFERCLIRGSGSDELVIEHPVVGEASVGLPGEA